MKIFHRIILVLIVVICYMFAVSCDHVCNDGIGMDGMGYFHLIQNFDSVYWSGQLDQYHMQRIIPFAVIHYTKDFLQIDATPRFCIFTMYVFNLVCILSTCIIFFRISGLFGWKRRTEIIAFSSMFLTYPILKYAPWYPILTDSFAWLLSFSGVYFLLRKKHAITMLIMVISMFAWPMVSVVLAILLMSPSVPISQNFQQNKVSIYSANLFRWLIALFVPVSITIFCVYYNYFFEGDMPNFNLFGMLQYDPEGVVFPVMCGMLTGCFLYMIFSFLHIDYVSVYKNLFLPKSLCRIVLVAVVFIAVYILSQYGGAPSQMTLSVQISNLYKMPSSSPLIFLETHFSIFPIIVVLLLCYWNRVTTEVCRLGLGFFATFVVSIIFCLDLETRKLISFYPIIMIPLWCAIDKLNFQQGIAYIAMGISLFASAFWYSPEIPIAKELFKYRGYEQFAGPWQGWREYVIGISLLFFSLVIVYFVNKRNLIYENTRESK